MFGDILTHKDLSMLLDIDYTVQTYKLGPMDYMYGYIPWRNRILKHGLIDYIPEVKQHGIFHLHKFRLYEIVKKKGFHLFCVKCGKEKWESD